MNKNEKRGYKNISQINSSHEFTVVGKAEIRVGIGLDGGISIINKDLAHAGVGMELGTYNEYFATIKVEYTEETNNLDSGIYAKIELGIYLKVKLECSVDVVFFKAEYKAEYSSLSSIELIRFSPHLTLCTLSVLPSSYPIKSSLLRIRQSNFS